MSSTVHIHVDSFGHSKCSPLQDRMMEVARSYDLVEHLIKVCILYTCTCIQYLQHCTCTSVCAYFYRICTSHTSYHTCRAVNLVTLQHLPRCHHKHQFPVQVRPIMLMLVTCTCMCTSTCTCISYL